MKKRLTSLCFAALTPAILSTGCFAENLDLALSDRSLKLDIQGEATGRNNTSLEASYFHNKGNRDLLSVGLHATNELTPVTLLVGGKTYYADLDGDDGFGVALGTKAEYSVNQKVVIRGQIYYSPAVTSFGDTEHYKEAALRVVYKALPEGQIFIGYRNVDIDMEDIGDIEMHEGGFAGVSFSF